MEINWFENKKDLLKGNSKTLTKRLAEVKNKKIHCQVSNKASSEDSDALEASCSGEFPKTFSEQLFSPQTVFSFYIICFTS